MLPIVIPTIICLLVGLTLAWRFKFLVLVPATTITILVTCAIMIATEYSLWLIILSVIAEATALQVGYFGGAMLRSWCSQRYRRRKQQRVSTKSD